MTEVDCNLNLVTSQNNLNSVEADRVLASIVKIDALLPIENADRIVVAEIAGWKCVVAKNDFVVGDLAIYYCEDSMPNLEDPNLKFLKDKGIKRIKIMKLRGVVSQGLLGPLKWLEGKVSDISLVKEGDDLTQVLQVRKYVKTEELDQYGNKGRTLSEFTEHFPKEIPKTDEDRLQNNLKYLQDIIGRDIVVTRKEDGCSCSFVYTNGKFSVCGRNFTWLEGNQNSGHYFHVEKVYDIGNKMIALGRNLGIQGEVVGPKVGGNKLGLSSLDFRVFNIFDIDSKQYLMYDEVSQICAQLSLKQVPLLYIGRAEQLSLTVPEFTVNNTIATTFGELIASNSVDINVGVKCALAGFIDKSNKLMYSPNNPAEGLVVKTNDLKGPRISFKVISNVYSLKHSGK